jgi:hypothetical protein
VGFVNDIKASSAAEDAKRAARDGRSAFVYKLVIPILNNSVSSPVSSAAEVIEAIEASRLDAAAVRYQRPQTRPDSHDLPADVICKVVGIRASPEQCLRPVDRR